VALRGGFRSEGSGRANRVSHRRDWPADHRHSARDPGVGGGDQERSAAPSKDCRRFLQPSQLKSRARRRRRFRTMCSRPLKALCRSRPTSPTSSAAPARPDRPRPRFSPRRSPFPATATAQVRQDHANGLKQLRIWKLTSRLSWTRRHQASRAAGELKCSGRTITMPAKST
jgi:hypothetical protein